MWMYLRKRRALRSYRKTLGRTLRDRYGVERHYSPEQVKRAAYDNGLDDRWICFAFAMYCDQVAFDAYHREHGETCDYAAMRAEAATKLDVTDTAFDATTYVASSSHEGSGDGDGSFDLGDGGAGGDGGGGDVGVDAGVDAGVGCGGGGCGGGGD